VVEGERLNAGLHQYSNDSTCLRLHQSVEVYSYMLSVVRDALRSAVKRAGLVAAVLERREKDFATVITFGADEWWCGVMLLSPLHNSRCMGSF
jgi:hypothetical protein